MTTPTPTDLPEALRLADICERKGMFAPADELRRLHAALAAPTTEQSSEVAQAGSITLDLKQATELLEMFGGEMGEIALMTGDGHSGPGLYGVWTADPEGSIYLGQTDEEAVPDAQPQAGAESYPPLPPRDDTDGYEGDLWNSDNMRAYGDATAALRARGAVPSEPTDEMMKAFASAIDPATDWDGASEEDRQVVRDGFIPAYVAMLAAAPQPPAALPGEQDAARLERDRICAAIKAEDDYCVDAGDYMLDSDDCIKIVRGQWVRPDFSIAAKGRTDGGEPE